MKDNSRNYLVMRVISKEEIASGVVENDQPQTKITTTEKLSWYSNLKEAKSTMGSESLQGETARILYKRV
jgi:hypothetical protein